MNAVTLQAIATVAAFAAFIGVCWWAYSPANRKRFEQDADIAMVSSPDEEGVLRHQPVFCLMKRELVESLKAFTDAGGRKIGAWAAQHRLARVNFNEVYDDPKAFYNANTLEDLQQLSSYEKH